MTFLLIFCNGCVRPAVEHVPWFSAQSCQGRCGQTFRRGQLCECDPLCVNYNTCCHDYQRHCGEDQHNNTTHLNHENKSSLEGELFSHSAPLSIDASVSASHQRPFQSPRATASSKQCVEQLQLCQTWSLCTDKSVNRLIT